MESYLYWPSESYVKILVYLFLKAPFNMQMILQKSCLHSILRPPSSLNCLGQAHNLLCYCNETIESVNKPHTGFVA